MSLPPHGRLSGFDLGRIVRLARKELSESLRDRRTILTLVLMPLLLYPLLAIGFQQLLLGKSVDQNPQVYRIAIASKSEWNALLHVLGLGRAGLVERHAPPSSKGKKGGLLEEPPHLAPLAEVTDVVTPDVERAVQSGDADLGVRFEPPRKIDERRPVPVARNCALFYREGSTVGRDAARYLERLCTEYNARRQAWQLRMLRFPQRSDPVKVRVQTVTSLAPKRTPLMAALVPLILILMTMTGAVYPAIDLTAGERERGTLEVLVAAPIPRMSVLFAKYVAVLTVAMLTALINLGSMAITLYVTRIGQAIFGSSLTPLVLLQVLGLLLLFAAFFSALLLALTSFARSFKEAQAYLIPLMLVAMMPGMLALMPGLRLSGPLVVAPLINVVLLSRDVFEGTASFTLALVVIATTLLYALAGISLAARIFGTEAVLSEQSGWADLLRRPDKVQEAPTPAAALLCLALMFPAYFLLVSGLAGLPLAPGGRLLVMSGASVLLFAGFPLASAWLARVRLVSAFRLRRPRLAACAGALLLGLCLWPFLHELNLMQRWVGFATLRAEHLEKLREVLEQWRQLSPVAVVLALAVVPAVLEELFFRGYLLSALSTTGEQPSTQISLTALLFALFHLIVTDSLAVERLFPSLFMGLVLGWVAWHSGSVIPGILLHLVHNGTVVLLAYYEPLLLKRGLLPPPKDHLSAGLLLAAGAGVVVGALVVRALGAAPSREAVPAPSPGSEDSTRGFTLPNSHP
jgi:ABC-2 type transport system permease protein/sodium transport system permease protein